MIARLALKNCGLFARLSDGELDKVASSAVERQFEAGSLIFAEGDDADEMLILQEGRVAIQMSLPRLEGRTSRRITVDIAATNDVIGWSSIVEPYEYSFAAVCVQRAVALCIAASSLRSLLRENPRIGEEVLKGLTR